MRGHARLARYAAPAAFLLAATIAILIIRSGLSSDATLPVTTAPVTATTTVEEPPETTTAATTTAASGAEYYEIQPGDTLAVVADEFDTTVEQLLVLNPDIDPVALTIGQQIRVK
jgi:LysM repeat protein